MLMKFNLEIYPRTLLFTLMFVFASIIAARAPIPFSPEDLYSGYYTASGIIYNYDNGQYSNTGQSYLHNVRISTSEIEIDGKSTSYSGSNGEWLHYGSSNGHPIYLYNKNSGELRWRFVFNFMGQHISDNIWYRGNQMSQASGGGTYSAPSTSGETTTVKQKCQFCTGSGKCSYPTSMDNKYYCQGNGVCSQCRGTKFVSNPLGGTVSCSWCGATGKCYWCKGTGLCNHCNGSGYK